MQVMNIKKMEQETTIAFMRNDTRIEVYTSD